MIEEDPDLWAIASGPGPVVATAIHDGHQLRPEVAALTALDEAVRLREEDPYTGRLAVVTPTRIIPRRSRFEVDLNRPRERAVYVKPADAWGLDLWRTPPGEELIAQSLQIYDAFYQLLREELEEVRAAHGHFVVLDLHSYNHRRDGAGKPPAEAVANPEINVGTGSMDRGRWGHLVERFMEDLRSVDVAGRRLDVRENVRFQGGRLAEWVHQTFPETGCALAIEFKKVFMDEWTGVVDDAELEALGEALASTLPGLVEEL